MKPHEQIAAFLEQIGASRLPEPAGVVEHESTWKLGGATIVIQTRADGTVRVNEVLVSSASLSRALDLLGNLEAQRIAEKEKPSHRTSLLDD